MLAGENPSAPPAPAPTPATPAPTATAPATAEQQTAADHFARGLKAFDKGAFEAARAEFTAAYQLTGSWEVLLNIGVTEENLLHYNEAVHALDRYLGDGGDKVPADRRARVEAELRQIRSAAGEVSVTVKVKAAGAPVTVEVDGRVVGRAPLPEPLLLPAGSHKLRASRSGDTPAEVTIDVHVGQRAEVALAPTPLPTPRPTTADLSVDSRPPHAALTVDGRPVGATPWKQTLGEAKQTLGEGTYDVAAARAGRADSRLRVELRGGIAKSVLLDLPALPPPAPPLWRRWYTITAAAVVVAGGAAAGIYVATHPRLSSGYLNVDDRTNR
jgi:hypothetical protein